MKLCHKLEACLAFKHTATHVSILKIPVRCINNEVNQGFASNKEGGVIYDVYVDCQSLEEFGSRKAAKR